MIPSPDSSSSAARDDEKVHEVGKFLVEYLHDRRDRFAFSLVCKSWKRLVSSTRRHLTVHVRLAKRHKAKPEWLRDRFPNLESLKVKGPKRKPPLHENDHRYDPTDCATGWFEILCEGSMVIRRLHFSRIKVLYSDLLLLAEIFGGTLLALKLVNCLGFSADAGLFPVAQKCRDLQSLCLKECKFKRGSDNWVREFAWQSAHLRSFTYSEKWSITSGIAVQDLELLATNCRSLTALNVRNNETPDMIGFFQIASGLKEFCGGIFSARTKPPYSDLKFPQGIYSLGLEFRSNEQMQTIFPLGSGITILDVSASFLEVEDYRQLFPKLPILQELKVKMTLGDEGLLILAESCKEIKILKVERGTLEDWQIGDNVVTGRGLTLLSERCQKLEVLSVCMEKIDSEALENIGKYLLNLTDFHLELLDMTDRVRFQVDPLDKGVTALVSRCESLQKLTLYLRDHDLTDVGLRRIGVYGWNVRSMKLRCVGHSDVGLLQFCEGCPSLRKLVMEKCPFTDEAMAKAATRLTSLRYLRVDGDEKRLFHKTDVGSDDGHEELPFGKPDFGSEVDDETWLLYSGY